MLLQVIFYEFTTQNKRENTRKRKKIKENEKYFKKPIDKLKTLCY